ncbi:SlyX family protein [Pseudodesulfovibrio sp. zrk46]|uniref:SlyX family protein n=1 Tax=Pseudodesulfovibrio sp. zrk46 TaxID=2725288 RepID=UPI0014499D3D|nr:SlyX family protein [Pseudodesulfovibrio sp. zrk46]QJB56180.1 SlyX family protein [Pseudodesulfovibrio sp. zrk46]
MEDRIERLENLVTLQDRTIESLNDQIYEQQKQINDLQRLVERLAGKVRDLDAAMDSDGPLDVPPPHYNG